MLTPTLVACLIFTIIPTIFMISMAFTTYNTIDMKIAQTNLFHWNGLDNFVNMFTGGTTLGAEIKNRFTKDIFSEVTVFKTLKIPRIA